MLNRRLAFSAPLLSLLIFALCPGAQAPGAGGIPHIEKTGSVARLVVDGKPFLILGGELHNSSASSLAYMEPIWPRLKALNLNTVLATVSWELLEPREGQFDFRLVDGLIDAARANHLHLVFLWFGSWKNGGSTYQPSWVRMDLKRFPRARDESGKNLDTLSTFGRESRDADARAYAALMKHLREVDGRDHTVLMMQVENEVGLLGTSRDYSPAAETAWKELVPKALLSYLVNNKESLDPALSKVWGNLGYRTTGTWAEVFGNSARAHEIFMAWQYAQYVDAVAAAGKAEYDIPMYANAWLVQFDGEPGGSHPSGGPVSRVMDIWRAGSSHLDMLAPDIYRSDFRQVCAAYTRPDNPLFVPEARGEIGASNALYAIGQSVIGFSPFAIDSLSPDDMLGRSYSVLDQLSGLLLANRGMERTASVVCQQDEYRSDIELGGYLVEFDYQSSGNDASKRSPPAAIIINSGPNEFYVAGYGVVVRFRPDSPGPRHVELSEVDEGTFVNGQWKPGRRLNGDETNGGNVLILPEGAPRIQRVQLFRHD
ncbi:MAG TPA: DUF5597 domain-containing protein [Blastocatellia bacterium]|nr:DUF5597 domain-containing protein [Blastocatellia bacterium]